LWTCWVARGFSQGGKVAERGPLATVGGPSPAFRIKFRYESVSGCGFLYTKNRNHRKTAEPKLKKNAEKSNLLKTERVLNTEI